MLMLQEASQGAFQDYYSQVFAQLSQDSPEPYCDPRLCAIGCVWRASGKREVTGIQLCVFKCAGDEPLSQSLPEDLRCHERTEWASSVVQEVVPQLAELAKRSLAIALEQVRVSVCVCGGGGAQPDSAAWPQAEEPQAAKVLHVHRPSACKGITTCMLACVHVHQHALTAAWGSYQRIASRPLTASTLLACIHLCPAGLCGC